ncbi:MAG: pantoate--beta-alanine ligase [Helicobacter sp.]|nr:pantoate--beta-alanine ligase [Helicobacter sp.]
MIILRTRNELKEFCKKNSDIGFVPTMGALHAGHEALIKRSVSENNITIVSIFVNPTQFLPHEDFNKYPRSLELDAKICEQNKVDAIFAPEIDQMYENTESFKIIPPSFLTSVFEGALRPSHFDGVCLIIIKLLNLIRPKKAYFGKKDAQQLLILQHMAKEFFIDTQIIPCEIVRDSNNLALSSRNIYLSEKSKIKALQLSRALFALKNTYISGEKDTKKLLEIGKNELKNIDLDYFELIDMDLQKVLVASKNTIAIIAGKIKDDPKSPRLLDNIWL